MVRLPTVGKPSSKKDVVAINGVTFDDSTTEATSSDIDTRGWERGFLIIDKTVSGTPTNLVIEVLTGTSSSPSNKIMDGPLGDLRFEDTAGTENQCIAVPYFSDITAIKASATGTTATDTFTLTVRVVGIDSLS